jgi:hypothetical protein
MMPLFSHRAALPDRAVLARQATPGALVAGGGSAGAARTLGSASGELAGTPDGPDLVLPSGVRIRRQRIGANRVSDQQLQDAIRGVQLLPAAHQRLLVQLRIPVELVPVVQLEKLPGTTGPVVGATRVVGPDGQAHPERIRIASYQAQVGTSVQEAVQHEIGHAIAVTAKQDTSEDTAIAYAARY